MRHGLFRRLLGLTATAALTAAALTPATPADAATAATTPHVVAAGLALDCTHMSSGARIYANAHNYCTGSARTLAARAAGITPDNSVSGNCGSSFIYITNQGGGRAHFQYGFNSTMGTVIFRSLEVNWLNDLFLNSGGWSDSAVMLSSSYSTGRTVSTGEGHVEGDLTGIVTLWWGGQCVLLVPHSQDDIT